jgi:hypothetical protein
VLQRWSIWLLLVGVVVVLILVVGVVLAVLELERVYL